jgi:hypothetical protein
VTGAWRKLHNEELHNLNSSPSIMRWMGHAASMGEMKNAFKILIGISERKRPLGRPRRKWKDNIKMYLTQIGWERVDRIHMVQDTDR